MIAVYAAIFGKHWPTTYGIYENILDKVKQNIYLEQIDKFENQ
jgi:hypothetical protein